MPFSSISSSGPALITLFFSFGRRGRGPRNAPLHEVPCKRNWEGEGERGSQWSSLIMALVNGGMEWDASIKRLGPFALCPSKYL